MPFYAVTIGGNGWKTFFLCVIGSTLELITLDTFKLF